MDATSYYSAAVHVAKALVPVTPAQIMNSPTTGSQPRGYSCLHFAADGSDRSYSRAELCGLLVRYHADLEQKTYTGNTPFLLASGTGVTDTVRALISCGAYVHAVNDRQLGAFQRAAHSSSTTRTALADEGIFRPKRAAASGRQWKALSESRQTRTSLRRSGDDQKGKGRGSQR